MTPEQERARGQEAERLAANPLFNESIEALRRQYYAAWLSSKPEDTEGRERLYIAARQSAEVFDHLRSMIAAGQVSANKIDRLKKAGR